MAKMTRYEQEARECDGILRIIVNRINVGKPDEHVRKVVAAKLGKPSRDYDGDTAKLIRAVLDRAVEIHHENLREYMSVMRGMR